MPTTRPPYPQKFRDRIIERARSGRSPKALAEEFEPTQMTIRNWLKRADRDEGTRSDGPTIEEKEEIRQLREKLRQLKQKRDIQANRCAFETASFAQETGDMPQKFPIHRCAPDRISRCCHVSCSGSVQERLLLVAEPT